MPTRRRTDGVQTAAADGAEQAECQLVTAVSGAASRGGLVILESPAPRAGWGHSVLGGLGPEVGVGHQVHSSQRPRSSCLA
jgi:hypothetical protein